MMKLDGKDNIYWNNMMCHSVRILQNNNMKTTADLIVYTYGQARTEEVHFAFQKYRITA